MTAIGTRDLLMLEMPRPFLLSNTPIRRFGCTFRWGFVIVLGHTYVTRARLKVQL